MLIEETGLAGCKVITTPAFGDARGYFTESYNKRTWAAHGIDLEFVQDNQSFTADSGTLRGMHFQSPPCAQDKLVRCLRGRILDVAVDIRRSSPTFGKHVAVELSAQNRKQLLVPIGFAHAFLTLEADVEVAYKVTAYYSKANDCGIAFADPALGIKWPIPVEAIIANDRDKTWPKLAELAPVFT